MVHIKLLLLLGSLVFLLGSLVVSLSLLLDHLFVELLKRHACLNLFLGLALHHLGCPLDVLEDFVVLEPWLNAALAEDDVLLLEVHLVLIDVEHQLHCILRVHEAYLHEFKALSVTASQLKVVIDVKSTHYHQIVCLVSDLLEYL